MAVPEKESNMLDNLNASDILKTTNIKNLNSDCLESIFEYLEFNDLLSLADSNKHFYSAICVVYKRKYENMNLIFDRRGTSR